MPPFAQQFAADPTAVDAIMFQGWGTSDEDAGWLAVGVEEHIDRSLEGWQGSAVFAEWGYERNPELDLRMHSHAHCDEDHTRRGAWRRIFRGLGIVHGFENSWGRWKVLDRDQPGLGALLHLRRFVTEFVPLEQLRPARDLLEPDQAEVGRRPQCMASADRSVTVVYLHVGGEVTLPVIGGDRDERWFDPRIGAVHASERRDLGDRRVFAAPHHEHDGPARDWMLVSSAMST
jgi:hypothetical protein